MRRFVISRSRRSPAPTSGRRYPGDVHAGAWNGAGATLDEERLSRRRAWAVARRLSAVVLAGLLVGTWAVRTASASGAESLYIGDETDNTIKQFDANSGASKGIFIFPSGGLVGPRAILHLPSGRFLIANQNEYQPFAGEIDRFSSNGARLTPLVPSSDPNAPYAPRGMVLSPNHHILYVADFGQAATGAVKRYGAGSGRFLGDVDFSKFMASPAAGGEFHPRGVVFGPDGRLYVSLFSENDFEHLGWILSYDPTTARVRVVATANASAAPSDCHLYLRRPEGLVFGPSGNLYVGGHQPFASTSDTDKVLVFHINKAGIGVCRPWIDLDQPGQPHTSSEALLFGPRGRLYVPMTVDTSDQFCQFPTAYDASGTDAGGVRAYNLATKTYKEVVAPAADSKVCDEGFIQSQELPWWWYLTFSSTDPSTLAYKPAG